MKKKQEFPMIAFISFIFWIVLFKTWPKIDLFISNLFFDGEKFPLGMKYNMIIKIIDHFIEFGCIGLWITVLVRRFKRNRKNHGLQYTAVKRKLLYISSVGVLGSVGAVHMIKRYIMRCRPNYIEFFGGPFPFTEVWTRNLSEFVNISKCASFVSGHSAIGFLIFAIAFIFPASDSRHKKYIILGTCIGGLFGFIRIIQGQHFLSDVIFSGYLVYFAATALAAIIKP